MLGTMELGPTYVAEAWSAAALMPRVIDLYRRLALTRA